MPQKTVFSGETRFVQVLDQDGKADSKLLPKIPEEGLKQLYYWMLLSRAIDDKCLKLQRSGRMGTFAQILGQEAQVGVALAMEKKDWLVPSFRENAIILALGAKPEDIFSVFGGFEEGQRFSGLNILPISIPVGTHPLHAVGIAWALKLKKQKNAVVTVFGDGATSEGDFHEAMNFASVYQVPCVLVCQNNQWAISIPRKKQTNSATIAQKALAYGMEGIQVDGNDVLAVYSMAKYALEKAKAGGGPTLLELVTYRMGNHTTADDATRYRSAEELEYWKKRDPVTRMQKFLESKKLWSQSWEEKIGVEIQNQVEKSMQAYEAQPKPPASNMFDFLYSKPTPEVEKQKRQQQEWQDRMEGKA